MVIQKMKWYFFNRNWLQHETSERPVKRRTRLQFESASSSSLHCSFLYCYSLSRDIEILSEREFSRVVWGVKISVKYRGVCEA